MTLRELIERVYWDSSEPSDVCPYTTPGDETTFAIASAGAIKLIRHINMGLVRIANWKFRDGRILRPRSLRTRAYFTVKTPPTGTCVESTDTTVTVPGLGLNVADEFNGWLIETLVGPAAGQIRLVTATALDGANVRLTVDSAWDTNPGATDTYALYKSFFRFVPAYTYEYMQHHILLNPTGALADLMRVRDVSANTDLARVMFNDMFTGSLKSTGVPSSYVVYGNELWLDVALKESRAYELLYMKHPAALTLAMDVPELPESYHEAIALWATHNVMRMHQDFNGAYATKKELEDLMEGLRLAGEFDMELDNGGVVVYG